MSDTFDDVVIDVDVGELPPPDVVVIPPEPPNTWEVDITLPDMPPPGGYDTGGSVYVNVTEVWLG